MALHHLMLQCWERDRTLRPSFGAILITLDSFLRCPELLSAPAFVPTRSVATPFILIFFVLI